MYKDTENLKSEIVRGFQILEFDEIKYKILQQVVSESSNEISRITSQLESQALENIVGSVDDFILGSILSFIYYKFILICSDDGNPISDDEIKAFDRYLLLNASKVKQLIINSIDKKVV